MDSNLRATDRASFFEVRWLNGLSAAFFLPGCMHLLYLDESGNPDDPADKHFILAGISAFENHGEAAVKAATEQVCKRFDTLLKRRLKDGDEQRGLIVFAESHYEQRAKLWVKGFRELGTQWGLLHSLCDIPYFAPAKESRLLQLADYVAHALFLLSEKQDATPIKEIVKKFDQADGVLHGLVHISDQRGTSCDCPACFSRRSPWHFGPLVS